MTLSDQRHSITELDQRNRAIYGLAQKRRQEILEDAKQYIDYGIKEGVFEQEQFIGMSDQELINFAQHEQARADWAADQVFEAQMEAKEQEEEYDK